jgi:hypothetical protein
LSDVTTLDAVEGTKGDRKRCKKHLQEAATRANVDNGNNKPVGNSSVACVAIAAGGGKRQAHLPTDHFMKLM